jgi:hypothetical protein
MTGAVTQKPRLALSWASAQAFGEFRAAVRGLRKGLCRRESRAVSEGACGAGLVKAEHFIFRLLYREICSPLRPALSALGRALWPGVAWGRALWPEAAPWASEGPLRRGQKVRNNAGTRARARPADCKEMLFLREVEASANLMSVLWRFLSLKGGWAAAAWLS